ncbi:unnamed protein product [Trichobilharzia regenti]|nr:unnamed protein product [Trichobilharzia regenti]
MAHSGPYSSAGAPPSSPNQSPRTFVPPYLMHDLFQPCKLLRRFFESLACGYMYLAVEQHQQQQQKLSNGDKNNTAALMPHDDAIPLACSKPFYLTVNKGISKDVCEKITLSAQRIVRQIEFKQIYKVLLMEPFPSPYKNNYNNNNTDESQSDLTYDQSVDDMSEDQDAEYCTGDAGVKRRLPNNSDNINSGETNADNDEEDGDDDDGVQEVPIMPEKIEPLYNSPKRSRSDPQ